MSIITLPLLIVTGAFAFWQRKDQPVEVFFRAGILFYTKPHIRKWDQDGAIKLVEVLVPKKAIKYYTDGRSAEDVQSQLNQLSGVLDTRGWNNRVNTNETAQTERLVPLNETPVTAHVSEFTVYDEPDDVQEDSSPVAQDIQQQLEQSGANQKEHVQTMIENQLNNLNKNTPTSNAQPVMTHAPMPPVNSNLTIASIAEHAEPAPITVPPILENQQQTAISNYAKITQAQSDQSQTDSNVFKEGEELSLH